MRAVTGRAGQRRGGAMMRQHRQRDHQHQRDAREERTRQDVAGITRRA
jgi:hypothetical protein